jgi:GPH family glycoside/pentoside/hexuronide:cation symporter
MFSMARFSTSSVIGLTQGYMLIFYTAVIGIEPIAVGSMFLISKILDGLYDPFIGAIVDKTHSRWGKMRPYMIFTAIPFGVLIILLFFPWKDMPYDGKIVYMYVTYILYTLLASLISVPLDGLPAVASPNGNERAKIISVSRVVGSAGEQVALVLYTVFVLFMPLKDAFMWMGIIIGAIAPVFLIMGAVFVKERIPPAAEENKFSDAVKYLFKNKQFLALILGNFLTFFRNLVSAMIVYIALYVYGNGSINLLLVIPGTLTSLLGMLYAPKLKRKFDAKPLFFGATVFHSAALILIFFAGYGVHWITMSVLLALAMAPVGILNVVPHLMTIDTLDYWEDKTGKRQEGIAFAIVSLRSNVSSAFKDYFMAWLLTLFLFATPLNTVSDHNPLQLDFTRRGLFYMFSIIPAVLNLLSLAPFSFYKLNEKRMAEIQASLKEKREKAGAKSD